METLTGAISLIAMMFVAAICPILEMVADYFEEKENIEKIRKHKSYLKNLKKYGNIEQARYNTIILIREDEIAEEVKKELEIIKR